MSRRPSRWIENRVALQLGTMPGGYGWVFPKGDHLNVGVGGWTSIVGARLPARAGSALPLVRTRPGRAGGDARSPTCRWRGRGRRSRPAEQRWWATPRGWSTRCPARASTRRSPPASRSRRRSRITSRAPGLAGGVPARRRARVAAGAGDVAGADGGLHAWPVPIVALFQRSGRFWRAMGKVLREAKPWTASCTVPGHSPTRCARWRRSAEGSPFAATAAATIAASRCGACTVAGRSQSLLCVCAAAVLLPACSEREQALPPAPAPTATVTAPATAPTVPAAAPLTEADVAALLRRARVLARTTRRSPPLACRRSASPWRRSRRCGAPATAASSRR